MGKSCANKDARQSSVLIVPKLQKQKITLVHQLQNLYILFLTIVCGLVVHSNSSGKLMTILMSRSLFGRLRDLVFRLKLRVGFFRFKNIGECPLCGGTKFRPVSSFTQKFAVIHIEQCVGCELILQNPRLDDQSLLRFYRSIYRRTHLGSKSFRLFYV